MKALKFYIENPRKPHIYTMGYKKPSFHRNIKRFENQENVERKIGSGQKCVLSWIKACAALKNKKKFRFLEE
jgi:hypothetical protein